MIEFNINDRKVKARQGWTILETARHYGIEIPTLCCHESVTPSGACRLCIVELKEGEWSQLVASCIYPVQAGINVPCVIDSMDTTSIACSLRLSDWAIR